MQRSSYPATHPEHLNKVKNPASDAVRRKREEEWRSRSPAFMVLPKWKTRQRQS
jgi:hypothetical protein